MTGVSAVRDSMGESYMMGAYRGVIRAEAGGIKLEGGGCFGTIREVWSFYTGSRNG